MWKVYGILVSIILVGIFCIIAAHTAAPHAIPTGQTTPRNWWESWPSWLEILGSTLLIAGTLGVVEKALLSGESLRQIQHLFGLHESTTNLGLKEVSLNAGDYNYSNLIYNSPVLQIVMNDGRTWISSRIDQFQRRFDKQNLVTEVFLIDPEQEFAKIIAAKTGYELDAQKAKIKEAVKRFIEEFERKGRKGVLRIYFLKYFPTHSIVLGHDTAVFTLYGASSGRRQVPTFLVRKTGREADIFTTLKADVDALKGEATLFFDSQRPAAGAT